MIYHPTTPLEAVTLRKQNADTAVYLAGGTDDLRLNGSAPGKDLIDISALGLDDIFVQDGKLYIGARCTFNQVIESDLVPEFIKEAAHFCASFTKRNSATVGGNIGLRRQDSYLAAALTAADVGAYSKEETYAKTEVYSREETYSKTEVYSQKEADQKFGTPYSLPAATVSTLGGVKVGDYLDIAPDGTLSGKTLNDKIAAAVAVKSTPRLVWNQQTKSPNKWRTYDVSIPDGVDYVHIRTKCDTYTGTEFDLARGGNTRHVFDTTPANVVCTMTFRADGTLHIQGPYSSSNYSNAIELWLSGYHYPTLAELLTETQSAQADTDALAVDQEYRVAMLELGLTDDTTTDTTA